MLRRLAVWYLRRHGYKVDPPQLGDLIKNVTPHSTPFSESVNRAKGNPPTISR